MKTLPLALLFALPALASAQDISVQPAAKRALPIAAVQKRLASAPVDLDAAQKNPFTMSGFEALAVAKVEDPKVPEQLPAKDLMQALAEKIDARARLVVNGEVMLLTSKQRLKVGSKVPVVHDGLIFEVEITAIDTARFTVRYKNEEYTRPITQKPSGK